MLSALPCVEKAGVDLAKATATVGFDPAQLNREKIATAIENAGYEAA